MKHSAGGKANTMVRIPSKQTSGRVSSGNSDRRQTLVELAVAALVRVGIWKLPSSGSRRMP